VGEGKFRAVWPVRGAMWHRGVVRNGSGGRLAHVKGIHIGPKEEHGRGDRRTTAHWCLEFDAPVSPSFSVDFLQEIEGRVLGVKGNGNAAHAAMRPRRNNPCTGGGIDRVRRANVCCVRARGCMGVCGCVWEGGGRDG